MIQIGDFAHIDDYKNIDEVWMIVRSLKATPQCDAPIIVHVPQLSPSQELFHKYLSIKNAGNWNRETFQKEYVPVFLEEMKSKEAVSKMNLLLEKGKHKNILLLCYCSEEDMCHRSIVFGLLQGMAKAQSLDIEFKTNGLAQSDYSEYYQQSYGFELLLCTKAAPLYHLTESQLGQMVYHENFYLLIAGSRNYTDYFEFEKVVNKLLHNRLKNNDNIVIISGGAKGADSLAERYAKEYDYELKVFKANWDKHGKSAGYKRNAEMHNFLKQQKNRGCLCFWDMSSSGTRNNFSLAIKHQTPIRVFDTVNKRYLSPEEIQKNA